MYRNSRRNRINRRSRRSSSRRRSGRSGSRSRRSGRRSRRSGRRSRRSGRRSRRSGRRSSLSGRRSRSSNNRRHNISSQSTGQVGAHVVKKNIGTSDLICIGNSDYCVDSSFFESVHKTLDGYKPVNCNLTEWSDWTSCNKDCGTGSQSRSRVNQHKNILTLGKTCDKNLVESKQCNTQSCVKHCKVGPWNEWSECDKDCGSGFKTRTREVTQQPSDGGNECPELVSSEECKIKDCPVDCDLSDWSQWTQCIPKKGTCGAGSKTRSRKIITPAQHEGKECGKLIETKDCNDTPCPLDCQVSDWGEWTSCVPANSKCGKGSQSRTRSVTRAALHSGNECPKLIEQEECNSGVCPVDCKIGDWSQWSECVPDSGACGSGKMTRTRKVLTPSSNGGKACSKTLENKECVVSCPVDCSVCPWTNVGSCVPTNGSCGLGTQKQTRKLTNPTNGGSPCPTDNERSVVCNAGECAVNCQLSNWSEWSECSGGKKTSTRSIITQPQNGGTPCGPLSKLLSCKPMVIAHFDASNKNNFLFHSNESNNIFNWYHSSNKMVSITKNTGIHGHEKSNVVYNPSLLNGKPSAVMNGYISVTNHGASLTNKFQGYGITLSEYTLIAVCNISNKFHPRDATWGTALTFSEQNVFSLFVNGNGSDPQNHFAFKHNNDIIPFNSSILNKNIILIIRYKNGKTNISVTTKGGHTHSFNNTSSHSDIKVNGISIGSDLQKYWGHNIAMSELVLHNKSMSNTEYKKTLSDLVDKWNF